MTDRKIAAIILAAGESARMGSPKAILEWNGITFLNRLIKVVHDNELSPIVVVLGAKSKSVSKSITDRPENLIVVTNRKWKSGQSSSLISGIKKLLKRNLDGAIILLVDQPQVGHKHLKNLLDSFYSSKKPMAITRFGDHVSPPTVIGNELFGDILQLRGDEGARKLLRKYDHEEVVSGEELFDIDTVEDYINLLNLNCA